MPIYEYRCESCGAELEKLRRMSDPVFKDCPECGEAELVKKISASSFRLKGTGWYETDFKTGKKKNGVADSPAESSNKTKTDSKPAKESKPSSESKSKSASSK